MKWQPFALSRAVLSQSKGERREQHCKWENGKRAGDKPPRYTDPQRLIYPCNRQYDCNEAEQEIVTIIVKDACKGASEK